MPRVKNPNRPKRAFLDQYKTYDPATEGYGSSGEWRQAFNFRLGLNAARERMKKLTPREVLGVSMAATFDEIKRAYRALVREYFPEKRQNAQGEYVDHGDNEKFLNVQAAFEILEDEFSR